MQVAVSGYMVYIGDLNPAVDVTGILDESPDTQQTTMYALVHCLIQKYYKVHYASTKTWRHPDWVKNYFQVCQAKQEVFVLLEVQCVKQ